jgi:TctA family transporter
VWTACLSLAVTPLMGFAIFPSNHVVLLPSLILIVMLVWERWTRQRVWFTLLVLLASFLVPFWLYYRVITGAPIIYLDLLTVLPPLASIVGLYWMRWWAVRLPRTWADQIEARR